MTLTEVIKLGKPFKRPKHLDVVIIASDGLLEWLSGGKPIYITKESLLADDWMIFEQIIEENNILMFRKRK